MRRLPPLALACLFSGLTPLACLGAGQDPVLAQADALIAQHQPGSAYALLAPLEDQRGGDPDYDYLLGLAALESGQAGQAAFAFERCLATDPKNGPCRVQMARTHLALGENQSARAEFETVEASQPPAEVAALVRQYLGTLAQSEASQKRRVSAYAQIGLGYDSNVSSTTDSRQIALPLFGGAQFTLSDVSTRQDDGFAQGEAAASIEYSLTPAWTLLADGNVHGRSYHDVDTFDTLVTGGSLGAAYHAGPHSTLLKLQAEDYQLDSQAFRSLYGLLAQYQYALDDTSALSGYVQGSQLDYHYKGTPDALRYTVGAGYSRALSRSAVVYGGLYAGQEKPDVSDIGLGQDFQGLRLGGNLDLSNRLRLTGSLSAEKRRFDGVSVLFLTRRDDTEVDVSLGAVYRPLAHLSLRPSYTYSNSHSNIVLSDYDRHVVSLDLRYEL